MNKKFAVGMLVLGLFATNGLSGATTVAADENTQGTVEFEAGNIDFVKNKLPKTLDFGKTAISYNSEANLKANVDVQDPMIGVEDKRGTEAGWAVKVRQTQFKTQEQKELAGAELTIKTGAAMGTIGEGGLPTGGKFNENVKLTPEQDLEIFKANKGEGNGRSFLELNEFDLAIPKDVTKVKGNYSTTLTWTISDTI